MQNIVSELALRVDSLVQQRVYLSVENTQLKQQMARLQQEKFVMERKLVILNLVTFIITEKVICSSQV